MSLPRNCDLLHRARKLRKEMTKEERHLWYDFLKDYPVKFYKQKIVGSYILDFYCEKARLAIEVDGTQHFEAAGMEYDKARTAYLETLGIRVLRFSNRDINQDFRGVCEAILLALGASF